MPTTVTGATGVSQIQAGATSDGLPVFQCRAWVNFDGTKDSTGAASTANTNRLIRGSGNVASVLRNGTGDYTVTFTTAMPDANYAMVGSAGESNALGLCTPQLYQTSSVRIFTGTAFNSAADRALVNVSIFR